MKLGVTAGVSALIVGTMPLFTALGAGWFLGETVTARQWLGSFIGLTGVFLVVSQKIEFGHGRPLGYLAVAGALLGITSGTLYQKKYCVGMDLDAGGAAAGDVGGETELAEDTSDLGHPPLAPLGADMLGDARR